MEESTGSTIERVIMGALALIPCDNLTFLITYFFDGKLLLH